MTCVLAIAGGCATGERPLRPGGTGVTDAADPLAAVTPSMQASVEERSVLVKTNTIRREHGLGILRPESRLMAVARRHASNMAGKDRFGDSDDNGHVLDGRDPGDRVQVGGYTFARMAENVGWQVGKRDPVGAMVEGWLRSTGHRKNLLQTDLLETGVGVAQGKSGRWYFVQLFAKPFEPTRRVSSRMVSMLTHQPALTP